MGNPNHKIRSKEEWKKRIKEWERSGLTITKWCEIHGESFHSFKHHRRTIFYPETNIRIRLATPYTPISRDSFFELPPKSFRRIK